MSVLALRRVLRRPASVPLGVICGGSGGFWNEV